MFIPFGVFSAAGAGGGAAAGAYELIETAYGTGSSGTIVFSSVPSTYKHLQLRMLARTTSGNAGSYTIAKITFNSDTGSNYNYHLLSGQGSVVSSSNALNQPAYQDPLIGENSLPNIMPANIIDILDYASTSKFKTLRTQGGVAGLGNRVDLGSAAWRSTSAISTITINTAYGNFATNSRISLYGIKG